MEVKKDEEKPFVQGTLGNLDIGWLNSRSAIVDRNMERELWQSAKTFLEDVKAAQEGGESKENGEDHTMSG